jgi:hypothetical protein
LIEKNGGSGRRSPTKADDDVIQAKSHAGRSPPVAGDGQEVGGVGRARAAEEEERKMGKRRGRGSDDDRFKLACRGGGGRWGDATRQERAEREGERGGPDHLADGARLAAAQDRREWVAWRDHAARSAEQGRGKGADRWAATTVSGGSTADRRARAE